MSWSLFGTKCVSCGVRTRDAVEAPAGSGLDLTARICKVCAYRFRAQAAQRIADAQARQSRQAAEVEAAQQRRLAAEAEAERKPVADTEAARREAGAEGKRRATEAEAPQREAEDRAESQRLAIEAKRKRLASGVEESRLTEAAETGRKSIADVEVAKRALEAEAERERLAAETDAALSDAVFGAGLAAVEALLEKGANVNSLDSSGLTPLHLAALTGHTAVAKLLLARGAAVDVADPSGATPLLFASSKGHLEIAEMLVAGGAEINTAMSSGGSPLYFASQNGHKEIAEILVANGADLNSAIGDGKTPLCIVAYRGHKQIAELLVARGAKLDTADSFGFTPLHHATAMRHKEIVEILLAAGANPDCAEAHGLTPLHLLSNPGGRKALEVAEVLVAKGADVDRPLSNGATPLHTAAAAGDKGMVDLLVANGANVNCETSDGKTPAHFASEKGHHVIAELLVAAAKAVRVVLDSKPLVGACTNERGAEIISPVKNGQTAVQRVITFTDENFDDEVLGSEAPVLVDTFDEQWWDLDSVARQYAGKVKVGRLDLSSSIAAIYCPFALEWDSGFRPTGVVRPLPALLLFKARDVVEQLSYEQLSGSQSAQSAIEKMLDDHVDAPTDGRVDASSPVSCGAPTESAIETVKSPSGTGPAEPAEQLSVRERQLRLRDQIMALPVPPEGTAVYHTAMLAVAIAKHMASLYGDAAEVRKNIQQVREGYPDESRDRLLSEMYEHYAGALQDPLNFYTVSEVPNIVDKQDVNSFFSKILAIQHRMVAAYMSRDERNRALERDNDAAVRRTYAEVPFHAQAGLLTAYFGSLLVSHVSESRVKAEALKYLMEWFSDCDVHAARAVIEVYCAECRVRGFEKKLAEELSGKLQLWGKVEGKTLAEIVENQKKCTEEPRK